MELDFLNNKHRTLIVTLYTVLKASGPIRHPVRHAMRLYWAAHTRLGQVVLPRPRPRPPPPPTPPFLGGNMLGIENYPNIKKGSIGNDGATDSPVIVPQSKSTPCPHEHQRFS